MESFGSNKHDATLRYATSSTAELGYVAKPGTQRVVQQEKTEALARLIKLAVR